MQEIAKYTLGGDETQVFKPQFVYFFSAMHTLWVRQHNKLARELSELNPHWNDEQIFQETRRIVGAQIQHITYSEFLPVILGKEAMDRFNLDPQKMGFFSGYDINTNPGTANSVSTAAFRFVASLLPGVIRYYDSKGKYKFFCFFFCQIFAIEPYLLQNCLRRDREKLPNLMIF